MLAALAVKPSAGNKLCCSHAGCTFVHVMLSKWHASVMPLYHKNRRKSWHQCTKGCYCMLLSMASSIMQVAGNAVPQSTAGSPLQHSAVNTKVQTPRHTALSLPVSQHATRWPWQAGCPAKIGTAPCPQTRACWCRQQTLHGRRMNILTMPSCI